MLERVVKTRVLIVDDSAMVRAFLKRELSTAADIEVVDAAIDPYHARDLIAKHNPDVLTLDIEMPRMDGLTFLRKMMEHHPIPTVIFSSLTVKGSNMALDAMQAGAVEVVCKGSSAYSAGEARDELLRAVRAAAKAKISKRAPSDMGQASGKIQTISPLANTTNKVIAIGASTGGTVALEQIFRELPGNMPGMVVSQHMPREFTAHFAKRLNQLCDMNMQEAKGGELITTGQAFIAPGGKHLKVVRQGGSYVTQLDDGPMVHFQKPSCDVMFQSVAEQCGKNAIGVILTGMGADGAAGLLTMRQKGAHTLGQDEKSCVVYGMPKAAAEMGAVESVVSLNDMAKVLMKAVPA
jgi:two-component system, chemotaxis family, protein-glutamate methylesterase/glutaminase